MVIASKWKTVATVGFSGCVNAKNENPAAHGCVCHLQARRGAAGLVGRKINVNGRNQEVGDSFQLDESTLEEWKAIERASR